MEDSYGVAMFLSMEKNKSMFFLPKLSQKAFGTDETSATLAAYFAFIKSSM